MLDPAKDKMAYFKDNIQTAEDQEDFDASQYYYNRQDGAFPSGAGSPTIGSLAQSMNLEPGNNSSMAFSGGLFTGRASSSLGGNEGALHHGFTGASDAAKSATSSLNSVRQIHSHSFAPQDIYATRHSAPSAELMAMLQKTPGQSTVPNSSPTFSGSFSSVRNSSLDMAEFPALASRVAGMSLSGAGGTGSDHSVSGDGMNSARSSSDQSEFVIQKEDFPALPGFGAEGNDKSSQSFNPGTSSATDSVAASAVVGSTETSSSIGPGTGRTGGTFSGDNKQAESSFSRLHQNQRQFDIGQKPSQDMQTGKEDSASRYGLLGLLSVIRMTNKDLVTLSLGTDLTALGLNLNSTECLYSTFASPWADNPSTKEPQYNLPICYYMQPPALKTSHLSKFQLETLFYIFYAMPKDILQAYAAQELYNREWQYHMDLKLWFKRAAKSDGLGSPAGAQYIYFDINAWERRLFAGNILGGLNSGLLREEDIKVKFSSS